MDPKKDLNILIDTKVGLPDFEHIVNDQNLMYRLSRHRHVGTYTNTKGIIVLYNKDKCRVNNLDVIIEGQMISFTISFNSKIINIIAIAPQ